MAEFKTPTSKRYKNRIADNAELRTPIKIPASPFLEKIGYGCGVSVFTLERSPKVGFTRSPWAVKKRNKIIRDEKYSDRIRFEAEILRNLNHPNIVGFRAFTDSEQTGPCLAMEKLDKSLGDLIEEKIEAGDNPFPAKVILNVGYEIIKGLEYLHHTAHILHGDIKSYNILISKDFKVVKLCDFGVSVPLTDGLELDTTKGNFTYVGTECWNAPEIIYEEGPVTNKTDIWAYGLVLWEMIALSAPHVEVCDDSTDEDSFDNTMSEASMMSDKENCSPDLSMNGSSMLKNLSLCKYGTRPPLPAIELGKEYDKVYEIFFSSTCSNYQFRPSAKGILMFYKNYVYNDSKKS